MPSTAGTGPAFAAVSSLRARLDEAIDEVCSQARDQFHGPADLAFVFVAADFARASDQIACAINDRLPITHLLGCTAESVIANRREIEHAPAIALWLARLPGMNLLPMHLNFERTPDGGTIVGWPDSLETAWPEAAAMIVLADPFSFPADAMLERLNEDRPGLRVVGGMASAGHAPGENGLILGPRSLPQGAVAVLLHGGSRLQTVVSQGCRPVGTHLVITKAERNVIHELGGKPALLRLKELYDTLPNREKELVQRGLHVGRVVSEYQDHFEQGDFLVRNVLGIDPDRGAIAIGDYVRPGQTVQFHIRDAETADGELRQLLAAARREPVDFAAALLFTCNGRGTNLFQHPDHDASLISDTWQDLPLAGFFAAGELGPIGGKNFVHGFTASALLFERG